MRKTVTIIGLILYAVLALPAPALADQAAPACPLQAEYVVEMTDTKLLGWNEEQAHLGSFQASIPAGTYELTLASWDDHSAKPDQDHNQPNEIWYLAAHGVDNEIVSSRPTPDLPGGQDLLVSSVGAITLTSQVEALTAHHGFFDAYNPNSVAPLCVGFTTLAVDAAPAAAAMPVQVALPAAPEVPVETSSRGIVADIAPAAQPSGVMGVQAQLVELPFTGFHPAFAVVGLMAIALGAGLLRVGGRATTVR
jgi:hypothetical protein